MGYHSGVFSVCTGHDRANHAVYAFGWGVVAREDGEGSVEYVEASNSWGTGWGAEGHFRIHPRCITDVTIPGSIESTVMNHNIGSVDPDIPLDAENPSWPWPALSECPFVDGCVTDMEGVADYSNNEKCVSDKLNGKKVRVVEFHTEFYADWLIVNGHRYTGRNARHLNGTVINGDGIKFTSDGSVTRPGFKICEY